MQHLESSPTEVERTRTFLSPSRGFEGFLDALERARQLAESHNGLLTELTLDGQRLVLQELEHAVLLRAAIYADSSELSSPAVEMLFYLDNRLACYPIALRGACVRRLAKMQTQQPLAYFADRWAAGLIKQNWVNCSRPSVSLQQGALLACESALSTAEKARLADWLQKSCCEATDGCSVEIYGRCRHGCPSWFVALSLIKLSP